MESEMTSRALLGQKPSVDIGRGCFPCARVVKIGAAPRPTAATVLVVMNFLRFMVVGWFGLSTERALQLLRSELPLPSAWKRKLRRSRLGLRPCDFSRVRHTTVRGRD